MALILKKGIFYHIPKTGGVWVGTVLKYMNLVIDEYKKELPSNKTGLTREHISPLHADKKEVGDKPSFAFIRNPIDWYKSIWKYEEQNKGWGETYGKYQSHEFNVFMKKIMDMSPGFLTKIYQEFDGVTYLGKQENLENDLVSILETLGEKVDYNTVGEIEPLNTSSLHCEYGPKILKRLKKVEKWIFEKYYPEEL